MALVTALLVLSLIDLDHQILPDVITLPGIALGPRGELPAGLARGTPVTALAAAAGGWLAFAAVAKAYEQARGVEGLGQGDWKMAAMLGAFLGWQKMLLTVLLASIGGNRGGPAGDRAARTRHALRAAARHVPGLRGHRRRVRGRPRSLAWYRGLFGG